MEHSSYSSRRSRPSPRPESTSSTTTRMTPGSSNNSSNLLPPRSSQNPGSRAASGGACLLHERLRERKVESARQSRRRSVEISAHGERGVQSSPLKSNSGNDERRPSSSGATAGKGMGVKQMEDVCTSLRCCQKERLIPPSKFLPYINRILISSSNSSIAVNDRKPLKRG